MGWTRKDLADDARARRRPRSCCWWTRRPRCRRSPAREIKKVPALRGKTIVNLFYENSTRTRTSFEIAGKWLSADVINFSAERLERGQGRELHRHRQEHRGHEPRRRRGAPLVGRRGRAPRPRAAVLDRQRRRRRPRAPDAGAARSADDPREEGPLRGAVTSRSSGDIAHSRVARSNIHGMRKLGMTVTVAGPPTLIPPFVQELGVKVSYRLEDAIRDVDVIMMLRLQQERMTGGLIPSLREYSRYWGLTLDKLRAPRAARRADHASRPGEPRGRALAGGRRRPVLGHPRPGGARAWPCAWACSLLLAGSKARRRRHEPADPERPRGRSRQLASTPCRTC